jgi:tetratricopeptide (TPR) repeat protein
LGKVLKLAPSAHCALGVLRVYINRVAQGIAECERAMAIDQNLAVAHAWIGVAKFLAGRNEETEGHVLEALRTSPRDAPASGWMYFVGAAELGAGRDDEAVAWLNRSIELGPNWPLPHLWLAAALARLDRFEEARDAVRAGSN